MAFFGGRDSSATIMELCIMEGYAVGFSIGLDVVALKRILGGDEGSGSVYQVGTLRMLVVATLRV